MYMHTTVQDEAQLVEYLWESAGLNCCVLPAIGVFPSHNCGLFGSLLPNQNLQVQHINIPPHQSFRVKETELYPALFSVFWTGFRLKSKLDEADMFESVFRRVDYFCVRLLDKN